jgi:hypothetical protein
MNRLRHHRPYDRAAEISCRLDPTWALRAQARGAAERPCALRAVLSIALLLVAAVVIASCATSELGPPLSPLPPNPPNLEIVSKAAIGVFAKLKLPGSPELSALRPALPSSLADWIVCMRSDADDIPRDYALFVRDNHIVHYRLAVQIDACARETFSPVAERP